ncbi:MAG TPA: proline/glycine betaine ABC transporter permease [Beijerinckiaceae bacterium]|jgi:glycine betaine/proline transport system permease protein|nr:proline/glycine betaine ABC transporter permease [Beijerinckiaceae bacterium]
MFFDAGSLVRTGVNGFLDWLVAHHGDAFEAAAGMLLKPLVALEQGLRLVPPWIAILIVAALAFAATRRAVPTLAITGCLYLVGCLGLWEQAMQTVAILSVAVALAVAIGLPVGIVSARSAWLRAGITPLLDLMQTIPSFVYLIPAAMLFGLGKVPAIVATVIYATPPLIRLTDLGLRQVDRQLTEAAKVLGANRWQVLRHVQLPLALPSIMQGVNQTTMMALGMVVIASMIGARGIGETVLLGLQRADSGQGAVGGLGIVLLAIVFDRITQGFGNRVPRTKAPGV